MSLPITETWDPSPAWGLWVLRLLQNGDSTSCKVLLRLRAGTRTDAAASAPAPCCSVVCRVRHLPSPHRPYVSPKGTGSPHARGLGWICAFPYTPLAPPSPLQQQLASPSSP